MHCKITCRNPLNHIIDISLTIDVISERAMDIQLPSWRPGRYELTNYVQNIAKVSCLDSSLKPLRIKKITKDRWRIETSNSKEIQIDYSYYANQLDAGGSVITEDLLYINFVNCIMYPVNRMDEEIEVEIDIPTGWKVGCSLTYDNSGKFKAKSYYQLVDSPMISAPDLIHWNWAVNDWLFHIWIKGENPLLKEQVINDFSRFIENQVMMMEGSHKQPYHFLFLFLPDRFHHGVEHADSTVIALGPTDELSGPAGYTEFLGVSSHELFHSWNITRLRPKELLPYDFEKENYFETGFVAEGVTTYYGDLFLVRSGVFSLSQYLEELNKLLKRHFENYGRNTLSVTESSFDLWLDGYKPGIPNRKVSIYVKGAIISLMMDLIIRINTENKQSLDDVIRFLWKEYYLKNRGYGIADFKWAVEEISNTNFDNFFQDFIYGVVPVEEQLSKLLSHSGFDLLPTTSGFYWERDFGFRIDPDSLKVIKIVPGSIAENNLSIDDLILSINEMEPIDFISENPVIGEIQLNVRRGGKEKIIGMEKTADKYFAIYQIKEKDNLTEEQIDYRLSWLGV